MSTSTDKAKAKASGVSSASFFDLKAEVAKKEDEFSKSKAAGKGKAGPIVGGVKREEKKPSIWTKKNKGVADRSAKDRIEMEALDKPTLESTQAKLEKKARMYDQLKRGKTAGLSDKQFEGLLVDFDSKAEGGYYSSDSDDVDESLVIPRNPNEDSLEDPMVEYQDEFGRMRVARRSEVPRAALTQEEDLDENEDDNVIYNPQNFFPTYIPDASRQADIQKTFDELDSNPASHFDGAKDVRAKGAGFYQFNVGDEGTRRKEMADLQAYRDETLKARKETGVDSSADGGKETVVNSIAEKRKRELEERRKLLDAKRRKMTGFVPVKVDRPASSRREGEKESSADEGHSIDAGMRVSLEKSTPRAATNSSQAADDFLANLERELETQSS